MKTKISIITVLSLVVVVGAYVLGLKAQKISFGGGSSIDTAYYKTATNTSVVCSGATSTLLLAAATRQDTRKRFEASVASSTITLCESATGCVAGNGLTIATATSTRFVQTSAYYGAYSCIGNGASSTVGIISSQN